LGALTIYACKLRPTIFFSPSTPMRSIHILQIMSSPQNRLGISDFLTTQSTCSL